MANNSQFRPRPATPTAQSFYRPVPKSGVKGITLLRFMLAFICGASAIGFSAVVFVEHEFSSLQTVAIVAILSFGIFWAIISDVVRGIEAERKKNGTA